MKQGEINYINMTDTVISGFYSNTTLWEGKIPIENALLNIKGFRSEITGYAHDQASATTEGATKLLKENMSTMGDISMVIVRNCGLMH